MTYAARSERRRDGATVQAVQQLAAVIKYNPKTAAERAERAERIKTLRAESEYLKAGALFPPPAMILADAKRGDIGQLVHVGPVGISATVQQVIEGRVILDLGNSFTIVVLGLNVDNLSDGDHVRIDDVVTCLGAKSYTTVLGATRTVPTFEVYRHLDKVKEWEQLRIAVYEKTKAEKAAAKAKPAKPVKK